MHQVLAPLGLEAANSLLTRVTDTQPGLLMSAGREAGPLARMTSKQALAAGHRFEAVEVPITPTDSLDQIKGKLQAAIPSLSDDWFAPNFFGAKLDILVQRAGGGVVLGGDIAPDTTVDFWRCVWRHVTGPVFLFIIGLVVLVLGIVGRATPAGVVAIVFGAWAVGIAAFIIWYDVSQCAADPAWPWSDRHMVQPQGRGTGQPRR